MKILTLFLTSSYLVSCVPPPHPAVVAVRRQEEQLPHHLRKPALRNPHLWKVLPLTSLLHNGEKLVHEREADHVPRMEIFNILTHAGFLPRRHSSNHLEYPSTQHDYPSKNHNNQPDYFSSGNNYASNFRDYSSNLNHVSSNENFDDPPFFLSPDLIQYL